MPFSGISLSLTLLVSPRRTRQLSASSPTHWSRCTYAETIVGNTHPLFSNSRITVKANLKKARVAERTRKQADKNGHGVNYSACRTTATTTATHSSPTSPSHPQHRCTTLLFGSWTVQQTSANRNLDIKRLKNLTMSQIISHCAVWGGTSPWHASKVTQQPLRRGVSKTDGIRGGAPTKFSQTFPPWRF